MISLVCIDERVSLRAPLIVSSAVVLGAYMPSADEQQPPQRYWLTIVHNDTAAGSDGSTIRN